ncbi:EamA family transporter RarD [Paenisporosarcina cavernae]|uniref:EamA family transporter RarD n=1 Tax=Paenisporosarcina cavernae TaxID=2320858 RepID=A0A385YWG4_9BACL|nr:EamA family transporter RarD [Paenisporosarcina cavernae]AYC29852.1 EamA family transporter RarD [Paenisporosarcina cavernae]
MPVNEKKGIVWAILAYTIWGFLPIYWKMIQEVSSGEILSSRIIWSFVFTFGFVLLIGQRKTIVMDLKTLWMNKRAFWSLVAASVLISGNWFLYIWAVNNGFLIQTSLGYYINPLLSVLLGIIFLKERLTAAQKVAVVVAAVGVAILTFSYGHLPWLALALAATFAFYGLMKKTIPLDALRGLTLETLFILPIAIVYYIYSFIQEDVMFLHSSIKIDILLILSGIATAIPLLLFAKGAQNIPLYLVGFLQYIAPTCMLLLGVIVYKESFGTLDFISFSFIWMGLIVFTISKMAQARAKKKKRII